MIRDLDGNPILAATFALTSAQGGTLRILVDCEPLRFLRAYSPDIAVEARLAGDVGWTNIRTTPIDLGAYTGQQEFELRLTAPFVSLPQRFDVRIADGRMSSPQAPDNFAAVAGDSAGTVELSWSAPADFANTAGYEVRLNCAAMSIVDDIADVGFTIDSTEVGLATGATAIYELRAYNLDGARSEWSAPVSVTVP